jgi:hypothetical protein
MRWLVALLIALLAVVPNSSADEVSLETNASLGITENVFFRNYIEFTHERFTAGASTSLIELDGTIYALTAKHLLSEDMGISPSIFPSDLENELQVWALLSNPQLFADTPSDVWAYVKKVHRPDDNFDFDLMVLELDIVPKKQKLIRKKVLPLSKEAAELGDTVYVIGCPYEAGGNCQQKIYSGTVTEIEDTEIAFTWRSGPDDPSGFSGAAVLNDTGKVIAVVWGGDGETGVATSIPTWLAEFGK